MSSVVDDNITERIQAGAVVCGVFGAYFHVKLEHPELLKHFIADASLSDKLASGDKTLLAKPRGKLRINETDSDFKTSLLAAGDRIVIEPAFLDSSGKLDFEAYILSISARANTIKRAAYGRLQTLAANIDHVMIIQSRVNPPFSWGFTDRVLVEAFNNDVEPVVVLNKTDLTVEEEFEQQINEYLEYISGLGVKVFRESALHSVSEDLKKTITAKRNLLLGPSGVGKSTLLNRLAAQKLQITAEITVAKKGRHTTVNPVMFETSEGTEIIDIPGVREYGLQHLDEEQVNKGFIEFAEYPCRFNNCRHIDEPGCSVKQAVADGAIINSRYQSYLNILKSLNESFRKRRGDYRRSFRD